MFKFEEVNNEELNGAASDFGIGFITGIGFVASIVALT
jgi:hypothetical protein